ncbi:MAG: hypothetical protein C0601_08870 [Candidatus Muiribacterium halophilum]|uniref:SGNH hydrolase-type esterase domain-containing protein n=1 Tax=Muiribacterium halophilum TaxID=2053465 RepID=A0A2N5ZE49_MUIH1|nr:MAG: hypothetical protein C0601_08870 [Candidatus Muirbacterium halophilum]
MNRFFKKILITAFGILFSLVLLEISFHIVPFFIDKSAKVSIEHNDNKKIVFCLGDSYTLGFGLPYEKSYPAILGLKLQNVGYKVENLGVATANTSMLLKLLKEKINKGEIPDIITLQSGEANIWNDKEREYQTKLRTIKFLRLIFDYIKQKNKDSEVGARLDMQGDEMEPGELKRSPEQEFLELCDKYKDKEVFFKEKYFKEALSEKKAGEAPIVSILREIYFGNLFVDISQYSFTQYQRDLIDGFRFSLHGDDSQAIKAYLKVIHSEKKIYKVMSTLKCIEEKDEDDKEDIKKLLRNMDLNFSEKNKKKIFSYIKRPFDARYVRAFVFDLLETNMKDSIDEQYIVNSFYLFNELVSRFRPGNIEEYKQLERCFEYFWKYRDLFKKDFFELMISNLKGFRTLSLNEDYTKLSKKLYEFFDNDEVLKDNISLNSKAVFFFERFMNTKDKKCIRKSLNISLLDKDTTFPYYMYELMDDTEAAYLAAQEVKNVCEVMSVENKKEFASILFEAAYRKWHDYEIEKALKLIDDAVNIIEKTKYYYDLAWYTMHRAYIIEQLPDKNPDYDTPAAWFLKAYNNGYRNNQTLDNMRSLFFKGLKDKKLINEIKKIIPERQKPNEISEFEPVRDWLESDYNHFFDICRKYSIRFIGIGYPHTRNIVLREMCKVNDIEYIELYDLFQDLIKKEGKKKYFLGDGHFSFEGNKVVSDLLKKRIIDERD